LLGADKIAAAAALVNLYQSLLEERFGSGA
jgi:hypothetical protein